MSIYVYFVQIDMFFLPPSGLAIFPRLITNTHNKTYEQSFIWMTTHMLLYYYAYKVDYI